MNDALWLVVNPAAGNGRAGRSLPGVLSALAAAGAADVRVCEATSLEHAAAAAADAARAAAVVAVGGDGLVGAVAGAVARAGGVLGIVPAGRGNDFARMLGIPRAAPEAVRALVTGKTEAIDLIGVRAGDGPEVTVAGSVYLGIVSEGGEIVSRARWVRGPLGYQLAGVRALLGWRQARFTVTAAGHGGAVAGQRAGELAGELAPDAEPAGGQAGGTPAGGGFRGYCVVAANSGYLAAGVHAAPTAELADGLLDVLTVTHGSRVSFLRVMRRAAKGTHLGMSQVGLQRVPGVTVTADRAMPAAADGETLPFAAPLPPGTPLTIRVLPAALQVIRPAEPAR